jgi:hypothetical protein
VCVLGKSACRRERGIMGSVLVRTSLGAAGVALCGDMAPTLGSRVVWGHIAELVGSGTGGWRGTYAEGPAPWRCGQQGRMRR